MRGMMDWQKLFRALTIGLLVCFLTFSPFTTQPSLAIRKGRAIAPDSSQSTSQASGKLTETAPPEILQELRQELEKYQPQVKIVSPRPNEVLSDNTVAVQFQVKDLPIFKDKKLGLGPHLHVLLDNRTYQAVYDIDKPLVFDKLEPGTHTLRAFASRPWHESFKNEGAYAQTTFHVLTKTQENSPDPNLPLLTYSRPQGSYGAEPILLDFYLTNAPLHLVARENKQDDIPDWRIRCTVNGKSFVLDQWQPVYLKGFKPGKNWVQLEFLDENGHLVPNVFNNTARIITYEPGGQDSLAKLVRGEISIEEAQSIVDPDYKPAPKPLPTPSPQPTETPVAKPAPAPVPLPVPVAPTVKPSPSPAPSISPSPVISPSPAPAAKPEVKAPQVEVSPVPTPAPAKGAPKEMQPTPLPATKIIPSDRPQVKTEAPEKLPSPETEKPIVKPESPKQSPQDTITNFLNRFRPAAKSSKPPAPQPSPVPSISPSPQPLTNPEASKTREPVPGSKKPELPSTRVTPQLIAPPKVTETPKPVPTAKPTLPTQPIAPAKPSVTPKVVETPQPTLTPKPDLTRKPIVTPKVTETPAPAVPKSLETGATPKAIVPPKPAVKPVPSPSPLPAKPVTPELVKPAVKPGENSSKPAQAVEESAPNKLVPVPSSKTETAKSEGSKALTEIQGKVTEKATELKSEFAARFNQLRDRFRRPSQPEATKPTPPSSGPEVTKPTPPPSEPELAR